MANRSEADVDQGYVKSLEKKLELLKQSQIGCNDTKAQRKKIFQELAHIRDQQLIELVSGRDNKFEDDFLDTPLQANWIQRKLVPETIAINKQELLKLTKNDLLEKVISESSTTKTTVKERSAEDRP